MIECPERDDAVVPTPEPRQWDTIWPIPAPEAIAKTLESPLKGRVASPRSGILLAAQTVLQRRLPFSRQRGDPAQRRLRPARGALWGGFGSAPADAAAVARRCAVRRGRYPRFVFYG